MHRKICRFKIIGGYLPAKRQRHFATVTLVQGQRAVFAFELGYQKPEKPSLSLFTIFANAIKLVLRS